MFSVQWVMPDTTVSLLFAWRNVLGKGSSNVWDMVPACLMWLIWWERNIRIFEDIESCRSLEVYASCNFVWMVSYLGVHAVYFYFGFSYVYKFLFDLLLVQWNHHREHIDFFFFTNKLLLFIYL